MEPRLIKKGDIYQAEGVYFKCLYVGIYEVVGRELNTVAPESKHKFSQIKSIYREC
jgi:hypothetical protein